MTFNEKVWTIIEQLEEIAKENNIKFNWREHSKEMQFEFKTADNSYMLDFTFLYEQLLTKSIREIVTHIKFKLFDNDLI